MALFEGYLYPSNKAKHLALPTHNEMVLVW